MYFFFFSERKSQDVDLRYGPGLGAGGNLVKAPIVWGWRSQEQPLPGDQAQGSGVMEKPGLMLFLSGPLTR